MNQSRIFLFILVLFSGIFNLAFGQNNAMLTGYLEKIDFLDQPYAAWFNENYSLYDPDQLVLEKILPDQGDISIVVLLGSWCGDTKRELPAFLKIMEQLNFPEDKITMIGLDRTKKAPEYQENIWNIEYVPTFIFLKNGYEVGRIVEQPVITLEQDIMHILGLKYNQAGDKNKTVLEHRMQADYGPLFGGCGELALTEDRESCSSEKLKEYINLNKATEYQGTRLEGTAIVQFIVDTDGLVKDPMVSRSSNKIIESEAFRLINSMNSLEKKWYPATKNDIPIASKYRVSIKFDALQN